MKIQDYVKARIQRSNHAMIVLAAVLIMAMNTVAADAHNVL